VLVAVSGGPDSVAMLDILHVLAQQAKLRLSVGHVDHGLRAESAGDAAFVAELAGRLGLPYLHRVVDVRGRVEETGESVEEAARELRYAALREMADEAGAETIATGHTADDQAETVLMRLLRGTGVSGLAGIPARRDEIVRPILPLWRADVLEYLRLRELPSCIDATNQAPDFLRNRIRLELLPLLEREYAPRLRERLRNLADMARDDAEALDILAEGTYRFARDARPDGVAFSASPDLAAPALRWRLYRLALAEVRGDVADISYEHLQAIAALTPHRQVHLPGARVLHEAGRLVFLPAETPDAAPQGIDEQPLPVPGTLSLPDAGCSLTTEWYDGPTDIRGGDIAVMDAEAVRLPLIVRARQPGDRFRPLGAGGTRKVQDILVDAGVPRRLRERVPVVCDADGIVWLAGFRVADRVKMHRNTRCLRICIDWELNPWTLHPSEPA
jgi:tRNA(Ile)-lysidine synthase